MKSRVMTLRKRLSRRTKLRRQKRATRLYKKALKLNPLLLSEGSQLTILGGIIHEAQLTDSGLVKIPALDLLADREGNLYTTERSWLKEIKLLHKQNKVTTVLETIWNRFLP